MTKRATSSWVFTRRFRSGAFGWRSSQLAGKRLKEAVTEIRQESRHDPVRAGEGVVRLLERIWPALQDVDSSSGALGNAVNKALDAVIPILASAPADQKTRDAWLDRLWQAIEDDGVGYLEQVPDHWGELCGSSETAARWADQLLPTVQACWQHPAGGYFRGSTACLSSLLEAERYTELLDLLTMAPHRFWHHRRFGFHALAALGRTDEALEYARTSGGLNDNQAAIDRDIEELLISLGEHDAAYRQYAISANQANTGLATFRNIAKKYPMKDKREILIDLIASTPGQEGRWFATARRLGLLDLAVSLADHGPVDPRTLNRAARDTLDDNPRFALDISVASLKGLCEGWGYEITSLEVLEAYRLGGEAAQRLGVGESWQHKVREILDQDRTPGQFVCETLRPALARNQPSLELPERKRSPNEDPAPPA